MRYPQDSTGPRLWTEVPGTTEVEDGVGLLLSADDGDDQTDAKDKHGEKYDTVHGVSRADG